MMTIEEVKSATAALSSKISADVQEFERATGAKVHSLPVHRDTKLTTVVAKVQI